MNILWPMNAEAAPSGVQRLARVLHWTFVGLGVWCFVWDLMNPFSIGFAVGAVGLALFGRTLRYVMAGE